MKPLLIVVPILLIGGTVGAGFMGVVKIPGITPKKAEAKSNANYAADAPTSDAEPITDTSATEPAQDTQATGAPETPVDTETNAGAPEVTVTTTQASNPAQDPEQGAKALAKYWDEIETTKLIAITETYKDDELARVLFFMNKKKVAELLSRVTADRAAKLSRELQGLASVVKPQQ